MHLRGSRTRIADNQAIASLIAGASGSNLNIERQYEDLLVNFDSNKPESPNGQLFSPINTTRSHANLIPKHKIEKRAMSIAAILKEAHNESQGVLLDSSRPSGEVTRNASQDMKSMTSRNFGMMK